jgi:DeoR/GlpR family transcriptional regulator of sugar metabolism
LADRRDLRLLLTGGVVTPEVGGCVDAAAVLAIQQMNIVRCVLGACAVSMEEGVSAFDPADALFKRELIARSRAVVMLVTTDKLGTCAPRNVAPLDNIDAVVVDAAACADVAALRRLGIPVVTPGPSVTR